VGRRLATGDRTQLNRNRDWHGVVYLFLFADILDGTHNRIECREGLTTTPVDVPVGPDRGERLRVRIWGYHYVEGQVKNVSDKPLKNVTAVGIWLDKDGNFIKSDDALIDYNPILPGQTSPFKTISSGNPAMSKYRVEFKFLFGGKIAVDDQRKK
jgi:hypothetical protein